MDTAALFAVSNERTQVFSRRRTLKARHPVAPRFFVFCRSLSVLFFSVTFRRLVTALAACALPEAWAGSGDGLFLVASASHDENDSEEGNNSRGVIKLWLLSANQLDKHAVANAKNRATSVICSLVCHRRHSGLAKSLSLSMCEGPDYDDGSKRGIYVTASIYGGFCAWCITAADFLSMSKGTAKTITSFKC